MNPYTLPPSEWVSYGISGPPGGHHYRDQDGVKFNPSDVWKTFQDQEIVWFPKTRSLAIQGHPEYFQSPNALFVLYCRYLVHHLILKEQAPHDIPTT
jgi:hypothetical protein